MDSIVVFSDSSAITVIVLALLSIVMKDGKLHIPIAGKFISVSMISIIAILSSLFYNYSYALFLFFIFQFISIVILYHTYLKSILYQIFFIPLGLIEEIVVALSLYFSFFITFSFMEKKQLERKGTTIILLSLLFLNISVLLELLNFIFIENNILPLSIALYDLFLILFFAPWVLPSELVYEKE
jgi:hypothetical protein